MEEWHDQIPNAPDLGDGATIERKPPYSIIVCALAFVFLVNSNWLIMKLRARCKWLVWDPCPGGDERVD